MSKILAKLTGQFNLVDTFTGANYGHLRAHVMQNTGFVSSRINAGQIEVISQLPDGATDKEWEGFLKDSDKNEALALASYLSVLKGETEEGSEPEAEVKPEEEPEAEVKPEETLEPELPGTVEVVKTTKAKK